MNSSWWTGINSGLSTPGGLQIRLTDYVFIAGSNASVGDGLPGTSYSSLATARASEVGVKIFVVDNYRITETNIPFEDGDQIIGNTFFTLENAGTFNSAATSITIKNAIIKDYTIGTSGVTLVNCFTENCEATGAVNLTNVITNNCDWTITQDSSHDYLTTDNQQSTCSAVITVQNADLSTDSEYTVSSGSVTISYSNNRMSVQTGITDGGNNIDEDPLHTGSTSNLEFLIQNNSPLIGAGTNGSTIGAFTIGQLVDFTGSTDNNVTGFVVDSPNDYGTRTPVFQVLSQVRKAPKLSANGILDFLNDYPYLKGQIPVGTKLNINYKSTFGGSVNAGIFLYGVRMYQDDSAKTTGEPGFNPYVIDTDGDLERANLITSANSPYLINVAEIQPVIELINDIDFGNALRFDGVNDFVSLANYSGVNIPTEFSLSFWFRWQGNPTNTILFDTRDGGLTEQWQLRIDVEPGNLWRFQLITRTGGGAPSISSWGQTFSYPDVGNWHHVVFTREESPIDSNDFRYKIYYDGIQTLGDPNPNLYIDEPKSQSPTQWQSSTGLQVTGFATLPFDLDEFSLVNELLSEQDVEDLYRNGIGQNSEKFNQEMYLKLNESGATVTASDKEGNHDGTLNNFTLPGAWVAH